VREVRLSQVLVSLFRDRGRVMTMPGLPRHAAAEDDRITTKGLVEGLF